ncbi:hypothetical protein Neosp_010103 [[Neocosmospora] mangrovei]
MSDQASFIEWLVSSCDLSALVQATDSFDNTPVHLAAQAGKENAVKQLLHLGSDLGAREENGKSPMHLAAENGHTETVRILFNADGGVADLLTDDPYRETPLHLAVTARQEETVKLLLSLKPDSRRISNRNGETALDYAARKGFNDLIDLLFEDQDTKKYDRKNTPLHFAAEHDHIDTVKLLVDKGASVTSVNKYDQTPLDLAIKYGREKIVQFLLGHPDVRLKDRRGNTLLHVAAREGHIEIFRQILDIKKEEIDVNSTNQDEDTPLHLAADKGRGDMVDFLIGLNNDGYEPLDCAKMWGHKDVVDSLVNKFGAGSHVINGLKGEDEGDKEDEASYFTESED